MPRDSIPRERSLPAVESSQVRSFRRTYPLVAFGHLLALLLLLLITKFVATRPASPGFFSPVSVGNPQGGSLPTPLSSSSPPHSATRTPPAVTEIERSSKAVSSPSKADSIPSKPASVSPQKKHIEAVRKSPVRPNLVEVTRSLPIGSAAAKPPAMVPHRAAEAVKSSGSPRNPSGAGEANASSSGSPSSGPSWYYALIRDRLYAAWDQPLHLAAQNLVAKVQIFVAKDGRISKPVLLGSSGNEEFDRTALAAADQVETVGEARPSDVPETVTVTFRMVR